MDVLYFSVEKARSYAMIDSHLKYWVSQCLRDSSQSSPGTLKLRKTHGGGEKMLGVKKEALKEKNGK